MIQYSITDWYEHFETAEARKTKTLRWVALPLKHDGLTYRRLMRQEPLFYLAWVLILGCAAKARKRGVLADENGPYDTEALSLKTDCPKAIFDNAIPALLSCGWLTAEDVMPASEQHPDNIRTASGQHPDDSGDHPPTVQDIQNKTEHPDAAVAASPSSGKKPVDHAFEDEFIAAWNALGEPFSRIRKWTRDRAAALERCIKDEDFKNNWRAALAKMVASDFHRGSKGWVADVDWFLKLKSFNKLMEIQTGCVQTASAMSPQESRASIENASPEDLAAVDKVLGRASA